MSSLLEVKKSRTLLAIALILVGQWFVSAHALEHGSEPHEHNGIVCSVTQNNEDDEPVPNQQRIVSDFVVNEGQYRCLPSEVLIAKNFAVGPPPTGPPPL